jgi:hypothetical protein
MHTMTDKKIKSGTIDVKALLARDEEFLRALMLTALQEVLEAEMTEALGAEKGERTAGRLGYRSLLSCLARQRLPMMITCCPPRLHTQEKSCSASRRTLARPR